MKTKVIGKKLFNKIVKILNDMLDDKEITSKDLNTMLSFGFIGKNPKELNGSKEQIETWDRCLASINRRLKKEGIDLWPTK